MALLRPAIAPPLSKHLRNKLGLRGFQRYVGFEVCLGLEIGVSRERFWTAASSALVTSPLRLLIPNIPLAWAEVASLSQEVKEQNAASEESGPT